MMNPRFYFFLFAACAFAIGLAGCDGVGSTSDKPEEEGLGDSTVVSFVEIDGQTDVTVDREVGEFTVEVTIDDPGFSAQSVDVLVDESSTAVLGEDVQGLSGDTTITFRESVTSGETRSITLEVLDLAKPTGGDKRRRTLDLSLSVPDTADISVDKSSFTLTMEERLTTQEARSSSVDGKRILVEGTVTRVTMDGAYLQDGEGALFLDGSGVPGELAQGDEVRVDGQTGYEDGVFQLASLDFNASTVVSQGNALPDPQPVDFDTLETNGEALESELVTLQAPFTIERGGDEVFQETEYSIEDSSIPLQIPMGSGLVGNPIPTPLASFQGVLGQNNGAGSGADEPDMGYQLVGLLNSDLGAVSTLPDAEILADVQDLDPGSGNVDAQCLVQLPSSGDLVFFNDEAGGIFVWDGSSLATHRSASDLNNDVSDESNNFDNCDGVTTADGFIYFILRSSATNDNYVYRTEATNADNNAFSQFSGANALAANASTVYIGAIANFGAPANGVFEISSDLSGSATEVASDENLNPGSMDLAPDGTLYGFSTSFGSDPFNGTVFSLDVTASSPSISQFTDPYADDSPLTASDFGGGIDDLQFVNVGGTSYLVVSNGGGSAYEWGAVEVSSQSVSLLFEQIDLEASLSVEGYDAFTAPLTANSNGEVFVASGGENGPNYIARIGNTLQ